ncbi:MAG: hypothetical protein HZA89_14310 [Verrucomicrobia bacterium]|nr:hypothetical protein [Verrucomicrobiota bacterium]
MDTLLSLFARALISVLQALPLGVVARLGRALGALAYVADARHRNLAKRNLAACFPEKTRAEITALARENFRRIGEGFACAIKTAGMDDDGARAVLELAGAEKLPRAADGGPPPSMVVAIGHFGNFEMLARAGLFLPGYQTATTFRGLRQPGLTRVLQSLREKSGCLYFERRTDAAALKAAMNRPGMFLGLHADQHAGDRGTRLPLFGRDCSTSLAPGVFALRYGCPLITAACYRLRLGRWRIELGEEIPTRVNGQPRPTVEIAADVNRAFEAIIRRDPANWFWVHNRWKPGKWRADKPAGEPDAGEEAGD